VPIGVAIKRADSISEEVPPKVNLKA